MASCPNCGKEVNEDFAFCPFCEYPLKPFCPSCRREVRAEYVKCPYCGFRLKARVQAAQMYGRGAIPLGLVVISIVWLVVAMFNLVQGLSIATSDAAAYATARVPPLLSWSPYAIVGAAILSGLLALFGVIQLVVTYGLLTRKHWSYGLSLTASSLVVLASLGVLILDAAVTSGYPPYPSSWQLLSPADWSLLLVNIFLLVLVRVYLGREYVKESLNVSFVPTVP